MSFLVAAGLLLTRPEAGAGLALGHVLSSAALIVTGLVLLRFGARGAVLHLDVSAASGELRDTVSGRVERARDQGRAALDSPVSLNIERDGGRDGRSMLVLHNRGE